MREYSDIDDVIIKDHFSTCNAIYQMISFTVQATLSFIYIELMDTVAIHNINQYATQTELAGYGFAIAFANLLIAPFCVGICYAVNVQTAQAIGQNKSELGVTFVNFSISAVFLFIVPMTCMLFFVIQFLKKKKKLSIMHGLDTKYIGFHRQFLPLLMISGTLTTIFDSFKSYIMAYTIVYPFKYISIAQFIVLIWSSWYFTGQLRLGLVGIGISFVLSELVSVIILLIYCQTDEIKPLFNGFTLKPKCFGQFSFFKQYLTTIAPIIFHMYLEMGIFLILYLLAARLGTIQFNAQIILINISGLYFKIPISLSMALQTYVGTAMGKNVKHAYYYSIIGIILFFVFQLIFNPLVWYFRRNILHFYGASEDVEDVFLTILPYFLFWTLMTEGLQETIAGILKGIEEAQFVANSTLSIFYFIGLPLIVYLGFYSDIDPHLLGFWVGFAVATSLLSIVLTIKLKTVDWEKAAILIRMKMDNFLIEDQQGSH